MELDVTSFDNAIRQLEDALDAALSPLASTDPRLPRLLQMATVQAFEFTYELSLRMLKRQLELMEPYPERVNAMTFDDLVRRGYEVGLVNAEVKQWRDFRNNRNITSHSFDEVKAQGIFEKIPAFLSEAKFLAAEIRRRQEEQP